MTTLIKRKVGGAVIFFFGLFLLARSQFVPIDFPPEALLNWVWSFAITGAILAALGLWIWGRAGKVGPLRPRQVLIMVLVVYLASFLAPAIDDGNQQTGFARPGFSPTETSYGRHWNRVLRGWEVFLSVPAKLPSSLTFLPAWLANPVLWAGLISLKKERLVKARRAGILCTLLALSTELALSRTRHWLTPLGGYYLWIGAMVAFLVGVSMCQANEPKDEAAA